MTQLTGLDALEVDVLGVDKKKGPLKKRACVKKETRAAIFPGSCLTGQGLDCLPDGLLRLSGVRVTMQYFSMKKRAFVTERYSL